MPDTTRVDLHCHSHYSDGVLEPREVVERLAEGGVTFAALTDHDSMEGTEEFREAALREGIGCVTGVELTVLLDGREAHLLGYGLDPAHPELRATLRSQRQARTPSAQSVSRAVRSQGGLEPVEEAASAAPNGRLAMAPAIELIHRAGGRAFIAHPLWLVDDPAELPPLLERLKAMGLDGMEALYGPYPSDQRTALLEMADELGLLVSAGTDLHERRGEGQDYGIDMPSGLWRRFRDAVIARAHGSPEPGPAASQGSPAPRPSFVLQIVVPTVLALILFVAAMFGFVLPTTERSLLSQKRDTIRELTNAAWSVVAAYERDVREGRLTEAEAKRLALDRVESLRYGEEGKDYFWIQDFTPRMIMHPYREDLEGEDVSDFTDPTGANIFVEFAEEARREGGGTVDYVFQWKDDPTRLAPKESYVRAFEPWGWVIGTGLYTDDVARQIALIKRSLVYASGGVVVAVALLLLYAIRQSGRIESRRLEAEEGLAQSRERYRALVEATTEGALMVLDGRCRYANPVMLRMLGHNRSDLPLLELEDVLPRSEDNAAAWEAMDRVSEGSEPPPQIRGVLRPRDGAPLECTLAISRISIAGRPGLIVLARPLGSGTGALGAADVDDARRHEILGRVAESIPVGVFRARASRVGTLLECGEAAARILAATDPATDDALSLSRIFPSREAFGRFLESVRTDGWASERLQLPTADMATRTVVVTARLAHDDRSDEPVLHGRIEDITDRVRQERENEAAVERLQSTLLFLHDPVGQLSRTAVDVALEATVAEAAKAMVGSGASAALVHAAEGQAVGIFTDADLRSRVVAAGRDLATPVYRVMTSPLETIDDGAAVYEALLIMEDRRLQHLAVTDDSGRVSGVVVQKELLQFSSYGPIVLTREIGEAATPELVAEAAGRAPGLAGTLLSSGAHAHRITRMLTAACDAATQRLIELAEERLGMAPVPYVFLGLGSQGRQEQVLSSDQDNALVYAEPDADSETVESYFAALADEVCGHLVTVGYPRCKADSMASNPRWRQPLPTWKHYFSDWIDEADAEQVLEFSIFFDFRPIHGSQALVDELRAHVLAVLDTHPAFLLQLAHSVLQYRPPSRLLGRLIGGARDGAATLNVKDALLPIIGFARLYSLR
ncbi:MAG: CBS domain-containing protein, partial [Armatimonadia bacterium]|nr:CBS domain-containing protein [Armatimonadia bacterium]